MSEAVLKHHGVKGMRWGITTKSDSGSGSSAASPTRSFSSKPPTAAKAPSSSPAAKAAPKSAKAPAAGKPSKLSSMKPTIPTAAPSRSFRDPSGKAAKDQNKMTPEQRAHRKKVILGTAAVVGILGVAVVGTAAYKGAPHAKSGFLAMKGAGERNVAKAMAHPEMANLKLAGKSKVDKARLNVLFKQAELAERASKTPAGILASKKTADFKGNPFVGRTAIRQDLGVLRRETAQAKSLNDAEQYIETLATRRAAVERAQSIKTAATTSQSNTRQAKRAARKVAEALAREEESAAIMRADSVMRYKRMTAKPADAIGPLSNRLPTPSNAPSKRMRQLKKLSGG